MIIKQTNECPAHRFKPSTSRDSRNRPQASQTSRPRRKDGNQEATSRSLLNMGKQRCMEHTQPEYIQEYLPNQTIHLQVKGE